MSIKQYKRQDYAYNYIKFINLLLFYKNNKFLQPYSASYKNIIIRVKYKTSLYIKSDLEQILLIIFYLSKFLNQKVKLSNVKKCENTNSIIFVFNCSINCYWKVSFLLFILNNISMLFNKSNNWNNLLKSNYFTLNNKSLYWLFTFLEIEEINILYKLSILLKKNR